MFRKKRYIFQPHAMGMTIGEACSKEKKFCTLDEMLNYVFNNVKRIDKDIRMKDITISGNEDDEGDARIGWNKEYYVMAKDWIAGTFTDDYKYQAKTRFGKRTLYRIRFDKWSKKREGYDRWRDTCMKKDYSCYYCAFDYDKNKFPCNKCKVDADEDNYTKLKNRFKPKMGEKKNEDTNK